MKLKTQEKRLRGFPICRGIAIGKPFFFSFVEDAIPEYDIHPDVIEDEVDRYRKAMGKAREDVRRLQRQLQNENILEGAAILEAQLHMMQDPLMTTDVENEIRSSHKNSEYVFQKFVRQYQKKFDSLADSYFRERFKDIQDISRRIIANLSQGIRVSLENIPSNSIIFAREISATDTAEANKYFVNAFVTETGSATSHAAIVAKAKGIPFVTNVDFDQLEDFQNQTIIVDGRTGDVVVNPSPATLTLYEMLKSKLDLQISQFNQIGSLPSETYDGYKVRLSANIEMANELEMLHSYGGHGVGLFRSEYIFLSQDKFPSEDEQFEIYKNIVQRMKGLPIVIRTFDVGGDKFLNNQQTCPEGNPYLGCRAIRFLLKEKNIFKSQLRAILRAGSLGDVRIMFPMVSSLSELMEAKHMVQEAKDELKKRKMKFADEMQIGCMIEVPSAAIICDLLAKECDFLSIGTNDLVQYSLAVDRGNLAMSGFYNPTHPSIIRLIKLIVNEANNQKIPVTICGEVAADPRFTALLLGLGVHELSVSLRYIPAVKNAIRNTSIIDALKIAEQALSLSTAYEIQNLLNDEYRKSVPNDQFYNF